MKKLVLELKTKGILISIYTQAVGSQAWTASRGLSFPLYTLPAIAGLNNDFSRLKLEEINIAGPKMCTNLQRNSDEGACSKFLKPLRSVPSISSGFRSGSRKARAAKALFGRKPELKNIISAILKPLGTKKRGTIKAKNRLRKYVLALASKCFRRPVFSSGNNGIPSKAKGF